MQESRTQARREFVERPQRGANRFSEFGVGLPEILQEFLPIGVGTSRGCSSKPPRLTGRSLPCATFWPRRGTSTTVAYRSAWPSTKPVKRPLLK
jgi:hypothetical protein